MQLAHFLHELVGVVGGHFLGDRVVALEGFKNVAQAFFHVFPHGFFLVQRGFLKQDADGCTRVEEGFAIGGLVQAGHDFKDG